MWKHVCLITQKNVVYCTQIIYFVYTSFKLIGKTCLCIVLVPDIVCVFSLCITAKLPLNAKPNSQ